MKVDSLPPRVVKRKVCAQKKKKRSEKKPVPTKNGYFHKPMPFIVIFARMEPLMTAVGNPFLLKVYERKLLTNL
jgi:hypothetical protein